MRYLPWSGRRLLSDVHAGKVAAQKDATAIDQMRYHGHDLGVGAANILNRLDQLQQRDSTARSLHEILPALAIRGITPAR
jgi:hypothetical protein